MDEIREPELRRLLQIEADQEPTETLHVLKTMRHAGRNVENVSRREGLFDATLNFRAGDVINPCSFLRIDKRSASDRRCRPGLHHPNIARFGMDQGSVSGFYDADINAECSAVQHALVEYLACFEIFPSGLEIRVWPVADFIGGCWRRGCRCRRLGGERWRGALSVNRSGPQAEHRDG